MDYAGSNHRENGDWTVSLSFRHLKYEYLCQRNQQNLPSVYASYRNVVSDSAMQCNPLAKPRKISIHVLPAYPHIRIDISCPHIVLHIQIKLLHFHIFANPHPHILPHTTYCRCIPACSGALTTYLVWRHAKPRLSHSTAGKTGLRRNLELGWLRFLHEWILLSCQL